MQSVQDKILFNPTELGCVLSLPGLPGGGSKIYDRSPYGNHGTITGATWKRLPSGLWCLDFDGTDDYVNCGTASSLSVSDMTLELWVYLDNLTANPFIATNRIDANNGFLIGHYMSENVFFAQVCVGGTWYTVENGTTTPVAETWYRLTATYESSTNTLQLFLNGIDETTNASQIAGMPSSAGLVFGIRYGQNDCVLDGKLALPKLYNHIIAPTLMRHYFHAEKHLFGVW